VACTTCLDGFYISQSVCKPCSTKNLFCAFCNDKGDTCTACLPPYVLKDGICYSSNPTTTNTNIVTTSSTDIKNSDSTTSPEPPKATEVLDSNGCNSKQIFYLSKCITRINECFQYQISGKCSFCNPNFRVTLFGDCAPKKSVLKCENGFWLNQAKDKC
jgi:hypothetical protein